MIDSTPKTIIGSDGRILFYHLEHFKRDIVQNGYCFICGARPDEKEFNDEHILPDWVLKKHKLYNHKITLPNGIKTSYAKYKVPCCSDCNSELGVLYEDPIRNLISQPYNDFAKELNSSQEKRDLLFKWLALIYFKTHLKDLSLRENLDLRKPDLRIGDRYFWEDFHHIHCLVRTHHTGAKIEPEVYGSILINQIVDNKDEFSFDYIDNPWTKSVFLQLGEIGIASVLDDSTAAISMYQEQISLINQGISIFQFYEIFAHFNFIRLHLEERPLFQSKINGYSEYKISCVRPEKLQLVDENERIGNFGNFLKSYTERVLHDLADGQEILDKIENGEWSFLWDENGKFIEIKRFE